MACKSGGTYGCCVKRKASTLRASGFAITGFLSMLAEVRVGTFVPKLLRASRPRSHPENVQRHSGHLVEARSGHASGAGKATAVRVSAANFAVNFS